MRTKIIVVNFDIRDPQDFFLERNPEFYNRYIMIDGSKEFFEYMLKPLRPSIRVNTLKAKLDDVVDRLSEDFILERVPWCREGFYINTNNFGGILENRLGIIFPQESASMIPPLLMEISPGDTVLDMCAAPGAKTTQIVQYMENKGCIVANEPNIKRTNILISNLQRSGVLIAKITGMNGRYFSRYENRFDSVLVDAPCSNVGMIRKNFRYLKFWRKNEIEYLSKLQKSLVMAGYRSLKSGGVLVYSTCTLDPLENEDVVDHLLKSTNAEIEKIDIPIKRRKPFTDFDGKTYTSEIKNTLRIHPQDNDTEAFFVVKIRKP